MKIKKITVYSDKGGDGYLIDLPQVNGFLCVNLKTGDEDYGTYAEESSKLGENITGIEDLLEIIIKNLGAMGCTIYNITEEVIGAYEES